MSKKTKNPLIDFRNLKSESDLQKLVESYNGSLEYRLINGMDQYALWGSKNDEGNVNILITEDQDTQELFKDGFDSAFMVFSKDKEDVFARLIKDGKVYSPYTWLISMLNYDTHDNEIFEDSKFMRVSEEFSEDYRDEATKLYEAIVLGEMLDSEVVSEFQKTIFDYSSVYNWVISSQAKEYRLQFLTSHPSFSEFYYMFADKYMILTPVKFAQGYCPLHKLLQNNPEQVEKNAQAEFKFTEVENIIDNALDGWDAVDIILNHPKILAVVNDRDSLPAKFVDLSEEGMRNVVSAVIKKDQFGAKTLAYTDDTMTYYYIKSLAKINPNYWHLFNGKYDELKNILQLLKNIKEIDPRLEIDPNEFLGKCDKKYIDIMTDTHVDTLTNDVINEIKAIKDVVSIKAVDQLIERLVNRNSMKTWYNINNKFHDIAPYLADFEYAISNPMDRCFKLKFDDEFIKSSLENRGIRFKQLLTVDDFKKEGDEMSHCVGGYFSSCAGKARFIFSVENTKNNVRSTLDITFDGENFRSNQHYGRSNSSVSDSSILAQVDALCEYLKNGEKDKKKEQYESIKRLYSMNGSTGSRNEARFKAKTMVLLTKFLIPYMFRDKAVQLEMLNDIKDNMDKSMFDPKALDAFITDCINAIRIDNGDVVEIEATAETQELVEAEVETEVEEDDYEPNFIQRVFGRG